MQKRVKLADLKLDYSLYPRHEIDAQQIKRLADAIELGSDLPPMIVEKGSLRVVDGFHRYRAYERKLPADAEVVIEVRAYGSDADLFLDAVRLNARHGVPFDPIDQANVALRGEEFGIDFGTLEEAMVLPPGRLGEIRLKRFGESAKGEPIILKPAMRHLSGGRLTRRQAALNERLVGMNAEYYLRTVVGLIRTKSLDLDKPTIQELLAELRAAVAEVTEAVKVAA